MTDVRDLTAAEDRLAAKVDLPAAKEIEVSPAVGGLAFKGMGEVMEFSKLMALSGQAVPKHLRAQSGMCLAVALQALNWRMDPFAVANKSYAVNDRLAYEAQLIQAVIEQRAPIKGRIKGRFEGEGASRVCVLTVVSAEDGDEIEYRSPEIGRITTKNSPLWKADPDQQLWYYSARAMCRRHFPDVLLGVYAKDEIEESGVMRDVTPSEPRASGFAAKALNARPKAPEPQESAPAADVMEAEVVHWTESIDPDEGFPGSEAFSAGAAAFAKGVLLADCPHEEDSQESVDWIGGYRGAEKAGAAE